MADDREISAARKAFEDEITGWLTGIMDHTDNDAEHDLLSDLIESIRERRIYRRADLDGSQLEAAARRKLPVLMPLSCNRCGKRLSRKTARQIAGEIMCSACLFPPMKGK